jgi:hypothetical protein
LNAINIRVILFIIRVIRVETSGSILNTYASV